MGQYDYLDAEMNQASGGGGGLTGNKDQDPTGGLGGIN
mgnify:CR=1 FL=1